MLGVIIVKLPDEIDLDTCIANVDIIQGKAHYHRHHRKIKPFPASRPGTNANDVFRNCESIGWNNCLSEILGETK